MANTVVVRVCTFIPEAWLYAYSYSDGGSLYCDVYYEGDNRGFDPNTASGAGYPNSGKFRTAQEIHVDFTTRTVTPYKNTGISHKKTVCNIGGESIEQAQASSTCISYSNETWGTDYVSFNLGVSCTNPFEPSAPSIDYQFTVTVRNTGVVTLQGTYDGFPNYEAYKKVDGGYWQTLFQHDHVATGETIASLAAPMEHSVNVTV